MKKITILIAFFTIFGSISQAQEKVFYSSFRPQGWDIYLSKDDGKSFSKFTEHESLDYDAKISPDGKWVVFTSERNGRPQLFLKSIQDGSNPRLLVTSNSMQDQMDFSPDGEWMAFVSTHEGNSDIYKLPFSPLDTLDISEAVNLTNNKGGDFRPKFSNDGKKIAFSSDRAHETKPLPRLVFTMQRTGDIYVMNADGSSTNRLTNSKDWEGSPVWSKDDKEILYYSADYLYNNGNESFKLFKMSNTGENARQISPDTYSCVSPLMKSDGKILFTSFIEEPNGFSILGLDPKTKEIDSSLVQQMNMLNVDYHDSGIMLYHGGETPKQEPTNMDDFVGDLLVKNSPQVIKDIPNKTLSFYGIRRSFAAPATPDGKIVYSVAKANSFQEAIAPFAYPVLLLPLLAIVWLLYGIYQSVKKRKTISFWKHLIFSLVAVVVVAFLVRTTDNQLFFKVMPISTVKSFLLVTATVLLVLGILAYFMYTKRRQSQKPIASLYKLYTFMFIPYALVILYAGLMLSSFFNTEKDFYAVDYAANKIEHLFNFRPDSGFNPQFSNIIDTKVTPDGKYLQFSVGGFRRSPEARGCVYRYHFENKSLERVTDLESNTGFADYSEDNKVMVFRSGRTGNMDIYVEENGTTTNITNSPDKETFPVISYDGDKIAYCSDVSGIDKDGTVKTMDIYLTEKVNNVWSEPKQLTTYSGQEGHPHFSPNGEWLIYTSEEFGINDEQPLIQPYIFSPQMYGEITAIRLADGEKFRLTHNKWEDGAPLWLKEN
ncbi:Tol biopolymer transport system component [Saonia flava]|uniref:Tol biopolymer transport system component n=1 Tax=Saonia flava TaxID=523696 RepID=A0A846QNN0_9FLAO|nr:PD40 domain-containing protein [Saonia flava]NJB69691.1 Tol biopolymer transport system component [Saonia flava]